MTSTKQIPIETIDPSPYQPRVRITGLDRLAESIKDVGLIQPVSVRMKDGRYELIAGERRWRACIRAGCTDIVAIIHDVNNSQARRMALAENIERDDLTPIEEVAAWTQHLDAELWRDVQYRGNAEMNGWPNEFDDAQARLRARWVLMKLDSDRRMETDYFSNKFIGKVETVFAKHPRRVKWPSFLNNDISLLDLPESVKEIAIEKRLNKSQSQALGKLAQKAPEKFEEIIATEAVTVRNSIFESVNVPIEEASAREIERADRIAQDTHVLKTMGSSESPEWYTPQNIIDATLNLLGEIDLDPCSNSHVNPAVPAITLYTKEDDGLSRSWNGRIYMNPPYGDEIPTWTDKLLNEYQLGTVREAIALLPGRIDTAWFQPLYAYLICHVRGRIQFANSPYSAPFPSVVVYLGDNTKGFIETFKELGPIMQRIG